MQQKYKERVNGTKTKGRLLNQMRDICLWWWWQQSVQDGGGRNIEHRNS